MIFETIVDVDKLPQNLYVCLKEKHFIYSDIDKEFQLENDIRQRANSEIFSLPLIFGICLTYNCNSKCIYCYENDVNRDTKVLSEKDIKMIFHTIETIIENNLQRKIHIFLEGGEPFMLGVKNELSFIFDSIRELKRRKKNVTFFSFTNGQTTLEYFNLIEQNKDIIDDFLVTIIGDKILHNYYRPSTINKDSYYCVVNTVDRLVRSGVNVKIVLNIDRNNIHGVSHIKELIKQKEWDSYPNFHNIHMSRIRYFRTNNRDIDESDVICSLDKNILNDQFIDWSDFKLYKNAKDCVSPLTASFHCRYSCTANEFRQFLFGPCGYIYSCTKVTGKPQYAIGRYTPKLIFYQNNIEIWKRYNIENIEKCKKCKFIFLCGGGCFLETEYDLAGNYIPKCPNVEKMLNIICNNLKK
jgi:uncharacterized protein